MRVVEICDPYTFTLRTIMRARPKFYFGMSCLKCILCPQVIITLHSLMILRKMHLTIYETVVDGVLIDCRVWHNGILQWKRQ